MKLPRHICMSIQHNPHRGDYRTIEKWLDDQIAAAGSGGYRVDEIVSPEDHAEILRTGEVWTISWCPDTPVGSCAVMAATLERALELANAE